MIDGTTLTRDDVLSALGLCRERDPKATQVTGTTIAYELHRGLPLPEVQQRITEQTLVHLKALVGAGTLRGVVDLHDAEATVIDLT